MKKQFGFVAVGCIPVINLMLTITVCCMATTASAVSWTNPAGGLWSVGSNWSAAPVTGDPITITLSTPGNMTITYDVTDDYDDITLGNPGTGTTTLSVSGTNSLSVGNGNFASFILQDGGAINQTGGSMQTSGPGTDMIFQSGITSFTLAGGTAGFRALNINPTSGIATFNVSGGNYTATAGGGTAILLGGNGGTAIVNQTSAASTVSMTSKSLLVNAGGTYNLDAGSLLGGNTNHIQGGTFNHAAGATFTPSFTLRVNNGGIYNFNGGTLSTRELFVGNPNTGATNQLGTGTFNHNSGSVTWDNGANQGGLKIGADAGASSYYNLGSAASAGTISDVGAGHDFTIYSTGVFRGHGDVIGPGAEVIINGRVIADGYGIDRTLNLTGLTGAFSNPTENTTDKGFYAVDHGKLTLRGVSMAATTNWGEQAGDAQIDLVNSAQLTFANLTGTGTLNGSLLAVDRADVAPAPLYTSFISVHEFSQTGSATFSSYDIAIRFDELELPTDPDQIPGLYFDDGSGWVKVDAEFDFVNSLVSATGFTSLGAFAVGSATVPEPSTFVLLCLALLPLRKLRRQRS